MASAIVTTALRAAKNKELRPSQLISIVKAGQKFELEDRWARYNKVKPGVYTIECGLKDDGETPLEELDADSPIEAKLSVIDFLIKG